MSAPRSTETLAIASLGGGVLSLTRGLGSLALLLGRLTRAAPRMAPREFLRALVLSGVNVLPLCLLTAALTGALVVIQTGFYVKSLGVSSLLGWGAGYSLFRELGPLLAVLVLSGRVGAGLASDVAGLRAGEQLPALQALGVDVDREILAPRLWAIVVSLLALVLISDIVGLAAAALAGVLLLGVPPGAFLSSMVGALHLQDVTVGLIKGVAFGFALGACSLLAGLSVPAEARGIGAAARRSVVWTLISVLALDVLLTGIL
jgi:phospholipid/cholesterol/gamma-HCH transport system permease protein